MRVSKSIHSIIFGKALGSNCIPDLNSSDISIATFVLMDNLERLKYRPLRQETNTPTLLKSLKNTNSSTNAKIRFFAASTWSLCPRSVTIDSPVSCFGNEIWILPQLD